MQRISSSQNVRFKNALRLHSARGRKQQSRIIIFGNREIDRAQAAGVSIVEIFVTADHEQLAVQQLGNRNGTEIFSIPDTLMQRLQFGDRREGLVAVANRPSTELQDFPDDLSTIVVLEQIEKPGNMGAIIRSIDASGHGGLILAQPQCDAFHPNAIRTSTGVNFGLPIAVANNDQVQRWLIQRSFQVLTAYLEGASDFYAAETNGPVAIVLGNEARGLSEAWRKPEFQPVKLPMRGVADSLNVSVTASVMLYEVMRRRDLSEVHES